MKLMLTADWHIKLGAKNIPEEWAVNRFHSLFQQIHQKAEQVDLHIIAGDVFDKLPNMQELALFMEFVTHVNVRTLIVDGNHEATKKGATFFSYLKQMCSSLNPLVQVIDDYHDEYGIDFIPYCKLKEFATGKHPEFNNRICVSHFRAEIPPHVKPEIPLELFEPWDTVLAGDLHSYDNCQRNILYPGSPVTTSFHRSLVDTGYILFDTETHEHTWHKFEVPQLIRKTVKAGEPTPQTDYHHTIYEVEGSLTELAALDAEGVIDKKIIRRTTDTSLILDPKMSMRDEVVEYFTYILELDEPTIERLLNVYDSEASNFILN